MKTIQIGSLNDMAALASELYSQKGSLPSIWLLNGKMGVGKTTFIQMLAKASGYQGQVSSPTFGLIHEYRLPDGTCLVHIDAYRINQPQELIDAGWYDYIDTGWICVEWPEQIEDLWKNENCVKISIEDQQEGRRLVKIQTEPFRFPLSNN